MSHSRPHLSIVGPETEDLRERFRLLTGRTPTPAEAKAFARWKTTLELGLTVPTRRPTGRVLTRL
jgi:hypothetical protein